MFEEIIIYGALTKVCVDECERILAGRGAPRARDLDSLRQSRFFWTNLHRLEIFLYRVS